ncbi:MAG: hypothetical protein E7585_04190 [Ruminococcaceae bacterium]|nr:hypothetical protein [Oscillospiraceae bacterium]
MNREHIPAENLAIWREAAAENRALRHLQITTLAEQAKALLREGATQISAPLGLCAKTEITDAFLQAMATDERMALCRAVLTAYPDQAYQAPPETPIPALPRVAHLSGTLFQTAFDRFSRILPNALSLRLSSLSELLEETATGGADFAIFPIEDTKGAHFLHFYEEFDRLELSAVAGCSLSPEENGHSNRFLLLSKQYRPPVSPLCQPIVVYRLPSDDQRLLSELLIAADLAGLSLRRLDALPAPYPEDSFAYYPVFNATHEAATVLNTYISIFMPRATVIAQYAQFN